MVPPTWPLFLSAGIVPDSVAGRAEVIFGEDSGKILLTADGIAGHAAAPEKCVNPIGLLAKKVRKESLLALSEAERMLFQFLEASCIDGYGEGLGLKYEDETLGKMSCVGTVLRFDEGRASLLFDVRIPPSVNPEQVVEEFKVKAHGYVMGGNTYARFFANGVGFGPGIVKDYSILGLPEGHGGGHACDEVQSVSSLSLAVKIYVTALWNLEKLFKEKG